MWYELYSHFFPAKLSLKDAIDSKNPRAIYSVLNRYPHEAKELFDYNESPFRRAVCRTGCFDVAIELLNYGANPAAITFKDGSSILSYCDSVQREPFLILALFHNNSCRDSYEYFLKHPIPADQQGLLQEATLYYEALSDEKFDEVVASVERIIKRNDHQALYYQRNRPKDNPALSAQYAQAAHDLTSLTCYLMELKLAYSDILRSQNDRRISK